jgi:predicted O-methyltransferase YrrM
MPDSAEPQAARQLWTAVDDYLGEVLLPRDSALAQAQAASAAAGLPDISVAPNQGLLLNILATAAGAKRILEIGTLGGYSTICLARALPSDGRLITLEFDPRHAEVARANLEMAGVSAIVDIRLGPALETLPKLEAEGAGPFDLVFIDADKQNNPAYLEWALKLARPGTLIVVDNVVRHGRILDANSPDADVQGTRRMFELMAELPRLSATAVQTVGSKGLDGLAFAVVLS